MNQSQQLCTFRLCDFIFGIEVESIQEVLRHQEMTPVPLAPDTICGLINLRGQIVTAIDLRARLGLPDRNAEEVPMNIIVRTADGAVSLLVDEIGDVLEVDAALYERPPATLDPAVRALVAGVYKLSDRLLLAVNVAETVNVSSLQVEFQKN